jgi:sulfate/thiosulfate transport system permease protein
MAAGARRRHGVLPGFGLTLGFTLLYLSAIVLIPLGALALRSARIGWSEFWDIVTDPRVVASYRVSLGTAFVAGLVNVVFGFLVAWVLVRYRFLGRRIVDAIVDLPFALPTAVSGIALTTLYSDNGVFGHVLAKFGVEAAYTPIGITIALAFVGFPFVVRTVQPTLEDIEPELEEAATSLGATRWQVFRRVIFPAVTPALITGFAMAFARGLGEYGSVVFIAGNQPMKTEITPLVVMVKLEQYDFAGATAVAMAMLVMSFAMILVINVIQWWSHKRNAEPAT